MANATEETVQHLASLLVERRHTVAVAESSTGGLVLSLLTDRPGASAWLQGGVVAYSNASKQSVLAVSPDILGQYGAVSPETAAAMACGACRIFQSTWAVAETGIVGPQSGHHSTKPTGLSCIAVVTAAPLSPTSEPTVISSHRYYLDDPGDRLAMKAALATQALQVLLQALLTHQP